MGAGLSSHVGPGQPIAERKTRPMLPWESRYLTGITSIDLQHRILADLTNDVHRLAQTLDQRAIEQSLSALQRYAIFHFGFEERLLKSRAYPELTAHQEEHASLRRQLAAIKDGVVLGQLPLDRKVMNFLEGWVIHHIVSADARWALTHGFIPSRPSRSNLPDAFGSNFSTVAGR